MMSGFLSWITFFALFNLGCGFIRSIRIFSSCFSKLLPLLVAQAATPKEPIYRLIGISRSIVGVDVPEPGVDAVDISESVRFMAFAIVIWTGCRRGWKMGAGIGGDILLQEPSR
jgi:hypothetical protein